MSNTAITPDYVKSNGRAGKMGQTLIAIVAEGNRSRAYVAPTEAHETLALAAKPKWKPETSLPNDPRNFWTVDYGLTTFGDLFTDRQLVALNTFSDLVHEARAQIETDARMLALRRISPRCATVARVQGYAEAERVFGVCPQSIC
jgi:putative DNA methylase